MVYLIHLERTPSNVQHCIGIIEPTADETLTIYYILPGSRTMAALLAMDLPWTVIRLWEEKRPKRLWPWQRHQPPTVCPVCGAKL